MIVRVFKLMVHKPINKMLLWLSLHSLLLTCHRTIVQLPPALMVLVILTQCAVAYVILLYMIDFIIRVLNWCKTLKETRRV